MRCCPPPWVVWPFVLVVGTQKRKFTTGRVAALAVHHLQKYSGKFPIFFDSTNQWHRDLSYHVEQPSRITACLKALELYRSRTQSSEGGPDAVVVELIDVATTPIPIEGVVSATHQPFSDAELAQAKDMLLQVHTESLVTQLEERCRNSKLARLEEGKPALGHMGYIDLDTYLTTESFDVCLRTTAAWIRAVDIGSMAMALTRPPGHHATKSVSNGFCLFNFAAAAAAHVLQRNDQVKVGILDWDVHYGQGVAEIMAQYSDRARYVSIHQTPAFPYMGESNQVFGPYGNIKTIPMPASTTWTCGYESLFEQALDFVCMPGEWEPDVIIVCAGYDALDSDELASVSLTAADFGKMSTKLLERARALKRPASICLGLEGGYQLNPAAAGGNLQQAVVECIRALVENKVLTK